MSDHPTTPGRVGLRARVLYKRDIRALRRYAWMRRACIVVSVSLLLAAMGMMLGWF